MAFSPYGRRELFLCFGLVAIGFPDEQADADGAKNENDIADDAIVAFDLCHEHFGLQGLAQYKTQCGQNGVPYAGTQNGVEQEFAEVHFGQTGRNGDELADNGHEATDEGGQSTVLLKIFFGFLYLFPIDEAHVPELTVGKPVDDGAAQPPRDGVVENGSQCGANGGKQQHEPDVGPLVGGQIGGRRHYDFRREGNKGTLDGHEQHDPQINLHFRHF